MDHIHIGGIHWEIDWMMVYMAFWMFLLGTVMGSFFDCIAVRRARKESVIKGRSHCDSCGHVLGLVEMVPLLGFLITKGKCRYCKAKIPRDAFFAELAGGVIFAGTMIHLDIDLYLPMWIVFGALLLLISLIDYNQRVIPNVLLIILAANRILAHFIIARDPWTGIPKMLLNAGSVSVPLLILVLIMDRLLKKETMGGGDIKLLFVIGLYMDWKQMILILFFACVLGIAGTLVIQRKKRGQASSDWGQIPFGPYIAASAVLVFWFGQPLIDWYLSLFRIL